MHKSCDAGNRIECGVNNEAWPYPASSNDLDRVDCVDCLRAVAVRATADAARAMDQIAELKVKFERVRADQKRWWNKLAAANRSVERLDAVRALSEERRYALHYLVHPDEGRTVHPTEERLRELAEPDAE